MRGTPEAYAKITPDVDTLYFISEVDGTEGVLYLGNKVIGGSSSVDFNNFSIDALKDVLITEGLTDKSLLVYQADTQNWTNVNFEDLKFIGATENSSGISGFIPAPEKGQTNLFLRSDGQWIAIKENNIQSSDSVSIDIYNNKLSLKDFGVKYYKYNSETDDYYLQIVDDNNPWKDDLIPKVVEENGKKILGWFEDIYDIKIKNLTSQLDTVFGIL